MIVVSSVSCIYGIGNPNEFEKSIIPIKRGDTIMRNKFLFRLVENGIEKDFQLDGVDPYWKAYFNAVKNNLK